MKKLNFELYYFWDISIVRAGNNPELELADYVKIRDSVQYRPERDATDAEGPDTTLLVTNAKPYGRFVCTFFFGRPVCMVFSYSCWLM